MLFRACHLTFRVSHIDEFRAGELERAKLEQWVSVLPALLKLNGFGWGWRLQVTWGTGWIRGAPAHCSRGGGVLRAKLAARTSTPVRRVLTFATAPHSLP